MATSTIAIINYIKNISPEWWAIIVSLLLGLFNLLRSILIDRKKERKKSDNYTVNKIINFLPQGKTREFIDALANNQYNPEFSIDLEGLIILLQEPNIKFFNKKLEKIRKKLFFSTKKLNGFLNTHFFQILSLFALYPEQKYSEDEKIKNHYEQKSRELKEIVKNFENDYNNFLKLIRQEKFLN